MPPRRIKKQWTVYVVRCANGSLYTGITNDLPARLAAHNAGRGAKYTAAFGPVELAWRKRKKDRSSASRLEAAVKKLSRTEKEGLISTPPPDLVNYKRKNFPLLKKCLKKKTSAL